MTRDNRKLTGLELADYLKRHRDEFEGNGDAFCMAAGYGIEGDDGKEKCNFKALVEALAKAGALNNLDID